MDERDERDQELNAALADAIWKRSKLTWQELLRTQHHGLGSEKISRASIKAQIPRGITEDVTFIASRFHGLAPMIGYRENRIFHVVWLDFKFSVYAHGS